MKRFGPQSAGNGRFYEALRHGVQWEVFRLLGVGLKGNCGALVSVCLSLSLGLLAQEVTTCSDISSC